MKKKKIPMVFSYSVIIGTFIIVCDQIIKKTYIVPRSRGLQSKAVHDYTLCKTLFKKKTLLSLFYVA